VFQWRERSERNEFRGGTTGTIIAAKSAPQAPTADISPAGGSAQAALPHRPWK
jgi:hypothetical protein